MKKEEKDKIMLSSLNLLKESAKSLQKTMETDFKDFTERNYLENIIVTINTNAATTHALLFNIMRFLEDNVKDDK